MTVDPRRATVFGQAAELYDRRRPTYPIAAVDDVLAAAPGARDLVDVGCGTGKLAVLFAARGLRCTGVEPDPAMAAVARRNLPDAQIVESRFEDWDAPAGSVDLVTSGQAWHWVDPAGAVPKAAHVLRPGGVLAIVNNTPRDGGMDLRAETDPLYEAAQAGMSASSVVFCWPVDEAAQRAAIADSGLFAIEETWHHDWDNPMSAEAYGELIQTHSDHRLLAPDRLAWLVDNVSRAIEQHGGVVTMRYRTTVTLARTPA